MLFGAHISISKVYKHAVKEALSIGANTLQFFTRNPRGSAAKALDHVDINNMR
jgi:deoxyribonuclease-4